MQGIAGQRVFVSAGAGGIGRAIADRFVQAGARVYVCDWMKRPWHNWTALSTDCPAAAPMWPTGAGWRLSFMPLRRSWAGWMCW